MLSPRPKPRAKAGAEASISAPSEAAAVSATALFLNLVMSLPPRAGARLRRSLHHTPRSRRAVEHAERVLRSGKAVATINGQGWRRAVGHGRFGGERCPAAGSLPE